MLLDEMPLDKLDNLLIYQMPMGWLPCLLLLDEMPLDKLDNLLLYQMLMD